MTNIRRIVGTYDGTIPMYAMPDYPMPDSIHDRTWKAEYHEQNPPEILHLGGSLREIPLDPATGKAVPDNEAIDDLFDRSDWPPRPVRHCSTDDPCCICNIETTDARTSTGAHHNEGCPFYELPDYGVFGPDE